VTVALIGLSFDHMSPLLVGNTPVFDVSPGLGRNDLGYLIVVEHLGSRRVGPLHARRGGPHELAHSQFGASITKTVGFDLADS
jgi:hypothetical protein